MLKSKLRVVLAQHEMTQAELAERTNIRPQTITNIVNNKIKQIPVDAVNKICDLLDCNIGDIFDYDPNFIAEYAKEKKED